YKASLLFRLQAEKTSGEDKRRVFQDHETSLSTTSRLTTIPLRVDNRQLTAKCVSTHVSLLTQQQFNCEQVKGHHECHHCQVHTEARRRQPVSGDWPTKGRELGPEGLRANLAFIVLIHGHAH